MHYSDPLTSHRHHLVPVDNTGREKGGETHESARLVFTDLSRAFRPGGIQKLFTLRPDRPMPEK